MKGPRMNELILNLRSKSSPVVCQTFEYREKQLEVRFIETRNIKDFLFSESKLTLTCVQEFIQPYGGRNHVIRVDWTPVHTRVE